MFVYVAFLSEASGQHNQFEHKFSLNEFELEPRAAEQFSFQLAMHVGPISLHARFSFASYGSVAVAIFDAAIVVAAAHGSGGYSGLFRDSGWCSHRWFESPWTSVRHGKDTHARDYESISRHQSECIERNRGRGKRILPKNLQSSTSSDFVNRRSVGHAEEVRGIEQQEGT